MNENKLGIDTMGKADDPAIEKDLERQEYYENQLKEIPESVPFIEIIQAYDIEIDLDGECYEIEEALCLIEENGSAEPLRLIMAESIAQMAEENTNRYFDGKTRKICD